MTDKSKMVLAIIWCITMILSFLLAANLSNADAPISRPLIKIVNDDLILVSLTPDRIVIVAVFQKANGHPAFGGQINVPDGVAIYGNDTITYPGIMDMVCSDIETMKLCDGPEHLTSIMVGLVRGGKIEGHMAQYNP